MPASAPSAVASVWTEYMIAGPHIMRTAPRSLAERVIRSPIRKRWKKPASSRSRWLK